MSALRPLASLRMDALEAAYAKEAARVGIMHGGGQHGLTSAEAWGRVVEMIRDVTPPETPANVSHVPLTPGMRRIAERYCMGVGLATFTTEDGRELVDGFAGWVRGMGFDY